MHNNQGERTDQVELIEAVDAGKPLYELLREFPVVCSKSLNYVKLLISQRDFVSSLGKRKLRFGGELREWQTTLRTTIEAPPDDRSVHWFIDRIGNSGKSYMCGYLQNHHDAFVSTGGKVADVAHAYNKEPIVIFDLPRAMEKSKDIYNLMEGFKNGCIFIPKYESACKIFDVPHVIVFANFEPDFEALSKDRWIIYNLGESDDDSIKDHDIETYGCEESETQDSHV